MKHNSRLRLLVAVFAVFAVGLAACGDDDDGEDTGSTTTAASSETTAAPGSTTTTGAPVEPIEVKLATVTSSGPDTAPILVGQEVGIWDECKIDVKFETFTSNPDVIRATTSGATQFSSAGPSGAVTAFLQGENVSIVSGTYNDSGHVAMLVSPDSDITSVKDLAGKKIGVASLNGPVNQQFRAMLEAEGLDPDSAEYVPVGAPQSGLAALAAGQVDVAYAGDPTTADQVAQGNVKILASVDDYLEVQLAVLVADTDWATENADDLDRYLDCLAKSQKYVVDNVEESAKIYAEVTGISEAAALATLQYAVDAGAYSLAFNEDFLDFTLEQLQALGQLPADFQKSDLDPLFANLRDLP